MTPPASGGAVSEHALVDLLDRLLAGGVVIEGEITLAVADVDLVNLSLRAVLAAVETLECPTSTR
jgi:hypothetical protein